MKLRSRKSAEVADLLLKSADNEDHFDDTEDLSDGDDYLEEHFSAESEENAESNENDDSEQFTERVPESRQSKKKGRPRKYVTSRTSNLKWSFNAPESRGRALKTEFENVKAEAKGAAKFVTTPLEAWSLLLSDEILNKIILYTNIEIERHRSKLLSENKIVPSYYIHMTLIEFKAFIGLCRI